MAVFRPATISRNGSCRRALSNCCLPELSRELILLQTNLQHLRLELTSSMSWL
jgi:hypothetical protein